MKKYMLLPLALAWAFLSGTVGASQMVNNPPSTTSNQPNGMNGGTYQDTPQRTKKHVQAGRPFQMNMQQALLNPENRINTSYLRLQPWADANGQLSKQVNTNVENNEFLQFVKNQQKYPNDWLAKLNNKTTSGLAKAVGGQGAFFHLAQMYYKFEDVEIEMEVKNRSRQQELQHQMGLTQAQLNIAEVELQTQQLKSQMQATSSKATADLQAKYFAFLSGTTPLVLMGAVAGAVVVAYLGYRCVRWAFEKPKPKTMKYSSVRGWLGRLTDNAIAQKKQNKLFFNSPLSAALEDLKVEMHKWAKGGKIAPNVLLHGKPGTGKSSLPYQWANDCNLPLIHTTGSRIAQLNENGLMIREVMALWEEAKKENKVIFFLDEIDLLPTEVSKALLDLIEGSLATNVLLVAASNNPEKIAAAVLDRINEQIEVEYPDSETVDRIFNHYLDGAHASPNAKISRRLVGKSPRTIEAHVKRAIARANGQRIQASHFTVKANVTEALTATPPMSQEKPVTGWKSHFLDWILGGIAGMALLALLKALYDWYKKSKSKKLVK